LPGLNLGTRPIDAVDLRFRRGQIAEVFVLGGIRELLSQPVLIDVSADFVVPRARLFRREGLTNDARAAIPDPRNHRGGHSAGRDIGVMKNGNDCLARFTFFHDFGHAAAHLVFDFLKHSGIAGKLPAQLFLRFKNRFGQIFNLEPHSSVPSWIVLEKPETPN
jgi:hypothetical protein